APPSRRAAAVSAGAAPLRGPAAGPSLRSDRAQSADELVDVAGGQAGDVDPARASHVDAVILAQRGDLVLVQREHGEHALLPGQRGEIDRPDPARRAELIAHLADARTHLV